MTAALCIVTAALIVVVALRAPRRRHVGETFYTLSLPPVPTQAEVDATWLHAWAFDYDTPTVPFSWAEQDALNEIERREFSGGGAL